MRRHAAAPAGQPGHEQSLTPVGHLYRSDDTTPEPIRYALAYARRGWPVLPCCWPAADGTCGCGRGHQGRDVAKAPLTPHGYQDATTDGDVIRRWWSRWPHANVAIAVGLAGLAVVDIDDPDALHDLADEGRVLPDTPSVTTGRGYHLYYAGAVPSGALAPGVEIKSHGGYVLAPPSRHASGRRYAWETTPRDVPLAEVPAWVRERRERPRDAGHNEPGWAARWLRCDRQHCGCMPRWRQCPAFDWLTQHRKEVR